MENITIKDLKKDPKKVVQLAEFDDVFIYDQNGSLQVVMVHPDKYQQLNYAAEELGEIDQELDGDFVVDKELGT
jgi:hypothetical protein